MHTWHLVYIIKVLHILNNIGITCRSLHTRYHRIWLKNSILLLVILLMGKSKVLSWHVIETITGHHFYSWLIYFRVFNSLIGILSSFLCWVRWTDCPFRLVRWYAVYTCYSNWWTSWVRTKTIVACLKLIIITLITIYWWDVGITNNTCTNKIWCHICVYDIWLEITYFCFS